MTRRVCAKVAGSCLLAYIAIGMTQMLVSRGMPGSEGVAERLTVM